MINTKINVFIRSEISNAKQRFKAYFSMENSLGQLIEVAKDFYVISIGINEINEGIKNAKRFKITILHLICYATFPFIINLFTTSNYLYSLLYVYFLPDYFRIFLFCCVLVANWILAIKIDMILAEIKSNLSPLKVFYFLINDIKSKHKLIDVNFNRLAILSRIVQLGAIYYGIPIVAALPMGLAVLIAILSQKIIWILLTIYFLPVALLVIITGSCWMCINLVLFSYYKMRFDQIHSLIKSIKPNGNIINKRKEKQLINLIKEHKSVSDEIHKLNSMFRQSTGLMAITLSTFRTIILFLLINFNHNIFISMMFTGGFIMTFVFGFGLSYLFSRQIKSAHQSDKLIYSILCRFKMRFKFRFKVTFSIF